MTNPNQRCSPIHWIAIYSVTLVAGVQGCDRKTPSGAAERHGRASTASQPASSETQPADPQPVPQSMPTSTYDSKPPYPVQLHVRDPDQEQPGWLKILLLTDENLIATAKGTFPEKNRICVETENVALLSIHISHLPLAEGKRIVLHIDDHGIELARTARKFVVLERRPTGLWKTVPEPTP